MKEFDHGARWLAAFFLDHTADPHASVEAPNASGASSSASSEDGGRDERLSSPGAVELYVSRVPNGKLGVGIEQPTMLASESNCRTENPSAQRRAREGARRAERPMS
jgi:hypothetical protein